LTSSLLDLTYEPLSPRHAAELFGDLQDERVHMYVPTRPPRSLESLQREYQEFAAGAPAGSGEAWLNWAIREQSTKGCVGTLQATRFSDGLLWIGYTVVPRLWGHGIATAAVSWLLAELRARFPEHNPLAAVDTRNLASIRVLQRTGFSLLRREPAELRGIATEDFIYVHGTASAA
jgi:[ribosomal protein S5]-alanine N-acetyltransferase